MTTPFWLPSCPYILLLSYLEHGSPLRPLSMSVRPARLGAGCYLWEDEQIWKREEGGFSFGHTEAERPKECPGESSQ